LRTSRTAISRRMSARSASNLRSWGLPCVVAPARRASSASRRRSSGSESRCNPAIHKERLIPARYCCAIFPCLNGTCRLRRVLPRKDRALVAGSARGFSPCDFDPPRLSCRHRDSAYRIHLLLEVLAQFDFFADKQAGKIGIKGFDERHMKFRPIDSHIFAAVELESRAS